MVYIVARKASHNNKLILPFSLCDGKQKENMEKL